MEIEKINDSSGPISYLVLPSPQRSIFNRLGFNGATFYPDIFLTNFLLSLTPLLLRLPFLLSSYVALLSYNTVFSWGQRAISRDVFKEFGNTHHVFNVVTAESVSLS